MIEIYTDGACPNNGKNKGIGGWAAVLKIGDYIKEISGSQANTTNNEMELMAAYEALKALNDTALRHMIFLTTDSEYLYLAFRNIDGRAFKYERQGWSKVAGVQISIPNIHLVRPIHELSKKYNVIWKWVRGHTGNEYNERADTLAVEERLKLADEIWSNS